MHTVPPHLVFSSASRVIIQSTPSNHMPKRCGHKVYVYIFAKPRREVQLRDGQHAAFDSLILRLGASGYFGFWVEGFGCWIIENEYHHYQHWL